MNLLRFAQYTMSPLPDNQFGEVACVQNLLSFLGVYFPNHHKQNEDDCFRERYSQ